MYNYKPIPETEIKLCEVDGCSNEGEHRAPKKRGAVYNNPNDYHWFCMGHIREFNKGWDYFQGMSDEEVIDFQQDAQYGHRPTWKFHIPPHLAEEQLFSKLEGFWDAETLNARREQQKNIAPIPRKEREALATLELQHPAEPAEIKKHYKKLAKQYHPDVNNNDKTAEERFKIITAAYQHLNEHYSVR